MKRKWIQYPPTDDFRTGCKVGWRTYKTKAEALACQKAALNNAQIQRAGGYDFGYCSPGSIDEVKGIGEGREGTTMFEVCIP